MDENEQKILAVMDEAGRPMTKDEITVIIALREDAVLSNTMAMMVLKGQMTAELAPGAADVLDTDSYVFKKCA
jgi:hypothetical protein